MSGYRCFTCPVEFNNDTNSFTVDCEPSELFQLQEYNIPLVLQSVVGWVGLSLLIGSYLLQWEHQEKRSGCYFYGLQRNMTRDDGTSVKRGILAPCWLKTQRNCPSSGGALTHLNTN